MKSLSTALEESLSQVQLRVDMGAFQAALADIKKY